MTPEAFEKSTMQILNEAAVMTLATCDGLLPWASDVYFASDGFELLFFSSPNSRHCRNLAFNPACSATIHPEIIAWQEIKGLQLEGSAEPADTLGGKGRGIVAYLNKFPFASALISNSTQTSAINKATLYVLRPTRIHYLDNSLGFGTRYCVRLSEGRIEGLPEREKSA